MDKKEKPLISKNRILHMHGVAEYMYKHAPEYGLDPERMYILGLLHDIGYVHSKYNHEKNGAMMLRRVGYVDADLVENHGNNPTDYVNDFIPSARLMPKELVLLWEADMLIDSKICPGEVVDFDTRLSETARKAGIDSPQYKNKKAKIEWLKKYADKYKIKNEKIEENSFSNSADNNLEEG